MRERTARQGREAKKRARHDAGPSSELKGDAFSLHITLTNVDYLYRALIPPHVDSSTGEVPSS